MKNTPRSATKALEEKKDRILKAKQKVWKPSESAKKQKKIERIKGKGFPIFKIGDQHVESPREQRRASHQREKSGKNKIGEKNLPP